MSLSRLQPENDGYYPDGCEFNSKYMNEYLPVLKVIHEKPLRHACNQNIINAIIANNLVYIREIYTNGPDYPLYYKFIEIACHNPKAGPLVQFLIDCCRDDKHAVVTDSPYQNYLEASATSILKAAAENNSLPALVALHKASFFKNIDTDTLFSILFESTTNPEIFKLFAPRQITEYIFYQLLNLNLATLCYFMENCDKIDINTAFRVPPLFEMTSFICESHESNELLTDLDQLLATIKTLIHIGANINLQLKPEMPGSEYASDEEDSCDGEILSALYLLVINARNGLNIAMVIHKFAKLGAILPIDEHGRNILSNAIKAGDQTFAALLTCFPEACRKLREHYFDGLYFQKIFQENCFIGSLFEKSLALFYSQSEDQSKNNLDGQLDKWLNNPNMKTLNQINASMKQKSGDVLCTQKDAEKNRFLQSLNNVISNSATINYALKVFENGNNTISPIEQLLSFIESRKDNIVLDSRAQKISFI